MYFHYLFFIIIYILWPIPVATKSKAWVCDHAVAGIVGSNPAEGMNVCPL